VSSRLTHHDQRRISKDLLRFETAKVLHDVYEGAVKMVAANRPPHGVSDKRVYRETGGADANRLEMLCEDLDRVVIEKSSAAVSPVLAYLSARYGPAAGAGDGVEDELAAAWRTFGEKSAVLIERMKDGLDAADLPVVAEAIDSMKRRLEAIEAEWKLTVEQTKFKRPKLA
jgi:hypothetical protein